MSEPIETPAHARLRFAITIVVTASLHLVPMVSCSRIAPNLGTELLIETRDAGDTWTPIKLPID